MAAAPLACVPFWVNPLSKCGVIFAGVDDCAPPVCWLGGSGGSFILSVSWRLLVKGCSTYCLSYLPFVFGIGGGRCGTGGGCTFGGALADQVFTDDVVSRSVPPLARCARAALLVVEVLSTPVALLRQPKFFHDADAIE